MEKIFAFIFFITKGAYSAYFVSIDPFFAEAQNFFPVPFTCNMKRTRPMTSFAAVFVTIGFKTGYTRMNSTIHFVVMADDAGFAFCIHCFCRENRIFNVSPLFKQLGAAKKQRTADYHYHYITHSVKNRLSA